MANLKIVGMNIALPKTVLSSPPCAKQAGIIISAVKAALFLVIFICIFFPSSKAQDLSLQTSPAAFGNVCINTTQGPNNFIIAGNNLSTADIFISSVAGFTFSTVSNGTYTNGLTITGHGGGNINITIYVRFSPIAVASYDGTIDISGGGDPTNIQASLSGVGVGLPLIAVTPAAPSVCIGSGTSLTASGGATYTWSPATGLSATSGAAVTASPAATSTYTVTGTDANGCISTADVTVTVNALTNPSVSIGADNTTMCAGNQVTFTATPLDAGAVPTYQWQISTDGGANFNNISGATAVTYSTSTLANNDKFRVIMTPDVICPSTPTDVSNVWTITVNPVLTATVSIVPATTYAICSGANATFTSSVTNAGAAPGYQWQLSTDGGVNFSDIGSATSAGYSGTFNHNDKVRLVLTSNGTCVIPAVVYSDTTTISISQAPSTADAGPDQAICGVTTSTATLAGNIITSGTGIWTLVSSTGSTPSITSPSNPASGVTGLTAPGTYIFQWTSTNSPCPASSDQVTITVSDAASAASAGPDQVVCGLSSTSLAATAITNPSTGLWTVVSGTPAPTISSPTTRNSTFTGTLGSTYVLRWTVTNGACVNMDDVQVSLVTQPIPSFTGSPATAVCLNASVTYSTQSGGGINDYSWTLPGVAGTDYLVTSGPITNTTNTITVQWLTDGSKTVTVNYRDASGCQGATAASVTTPVNLAPTLSLSSAAGTNNQTICGGTASLAALTYNFTGSTNVTVSGLPTGLSGSLSGSTYTISKTGNVAAGTYNYNVSAAALTGCTGSATATGTITVYTGNPGFPGNPRITGPNGHCPTGQITLTVDAASNTQFYQWFVEGNELPSNGWIIVSGGGTNSITIQSTGTVSFANNANTFSVTAANPCGTDPINASRHLDLNVSTFNGVTAGNDFTICQGASINLSGTLQGAATTGSWTLISGSGTLGGSTTTGTTVTANFAPSFSSGTATLRITSNDASGTCNTEVTDDMVVTVVPTPSASFGTTITVCEGNSGTLTINGTPNAVVNYTKGGAAQTAVTLDALGTASISTGILTTNTDFQLTSFGYAGAPNCTQTLTAGLTVTVNPKAIVNAGNDVTVCGNVTDVPLPGAISGSATAATWSGGGGVFVASGLNATYTPTAAEITAGSVSLYFTATAGFVAPCQATQDTITIFFSPAPTVYAGADKEKCQQASPAAISLADATRGGSASNATWSIIAGAGTLSNTSATTTPGTVTFTPDAGFNGLVRLKLASNDPPGVCVPVADTIEINITALPTVNVGADLTICSNSTVTATAVLGGTAVSGTWSSSGNGSFNDANATGAVYTLGTNDINNGTVTLSFTSNDPAGDCTAASDAFTITIKDSIHISSNPVNVGLCAGNNTSFTAVATGDDLQYQWYKGVAPGGVALTNAGNISGATTAQLSFSPATAINDGSYYFVVSANNSNCAAKTSTAATLNVDESIEISAQPTAQSVCQGAPFSFEVAAAAGSDVLTYQWRKDGVNILNAAGPSYSGTATLAMQGNYDVVISGYPGYTCPNITSSAVALTVTPTVGTPSAISVAAGTEPTCQLTNATTTTTYATTATNNTGLNWSLTNPSAGAIDAATGVMTWANGFAGSVDIRVTASGCNGPSTQVVRAVSITPTVGTPTPITISAGTEPTCQLINATTTTTYATTATNSTGFNWSLSNGAAGSINATTGVMTWANGFSGSVDIRVTANGCNSPSSQVIHPVTINPTVGTPTAITFPAGTEPTCQLTNGTTTTAYATTATNNTGFNWTISNALAGNIDAATGVMAWANGFTGSVDIRVTASGCNGPSSQISRSVNIVASIGTPVFALGATSSRCQGAGTGTYTAAATGSTSISYSLDASTLAFTGNSINSGTGVVTFAGGWTGTSQVTATAQGCNGPASAIHTITIDATSLGGTTYLDDTTTKTIRTGCPYISGVIDVTGFTGAVTRWEYSTNGGGNWTPITSTATEISYTDLTQTRLYRAVITNGNCAEAFSSTVLVSVIPPAIPDALATPATICTGDSSILTSTTGYANPWPSGIDGTFNQANPAGWRIYDGNEPGYINFPANADNGVTNPWSETNGPKTFFQGTPYEVTYNNISPAGINGKFAVSTGAIYTTMETPVFSTIGMPSASLDFTHAFILTPGSSARVEISLDGGTSYLTTPLMQWNGQDTEGTPLNSWEALTINLNNYLGQPNVRIRFVSNFVSGPTLSTWAIDGVGFPAAAPPVTYVWTPTGTGTGSPITVFPLTTTTYTLTSYIGTCYGGEDNVTVTVNPRASIVADAATPNRCASTTAQTTTLGWNTPVNNPIRYSITWLPTPANAFAAVTNLDLPAGDIQINIPANTAAGEYKGVISVSNSFNCRAPGDTFTITIYPRPIGTPVSPGPICSGTVTDISLGANVPSNFTWTIGTVTGNITGAMASSGSTIAQTLTNNGSTPGTVEYIVTPTAVLGSCTGAPYSIIVTVDPNVGITAQPLSTKACVGSSITISAGSANATNFKWQRKTLTGTWTDIDGLLDGGIYSTFNTNTLTIAANIPITSLIPLIDNQYRVEVGNSCNSLMSATATLLFNYVWTGNVSNDWNVTDNWLAKEIPTINCPNVYLVGDRPNEPNLSTATPPMINNLHILQNADFTLANGDGVGTGTKLMVAGHITRYPSSTFEALDGTLEMSGGTQNIDASTFNRDDLENLIVSSSSNLTLDGPVDIFESVTFGSTGVNLATNGHLTLKSLSLRTARLGTLNYPAQTVTGEATVERYLRPRMAWRFLAIPTSGGQTINQAWQEGATAPNADPNPGYGTQITGPVVANGIDAYTINPSMKAFNSSTYLWDGEASTQVPIEDRRGYMLFVRGDRSSLAPTCETCPQPTVKETTLRTKGTFFKGVQLYDLALPNDWLSVGNPFASQVDLRLVGKTGGLVNAFTIWDSYPLGNYWVGAYQTLVLQGGNYVNVSVAGMPVQNYIESGQAFFIQSDNVGSANLAIREADKGTGSQNVSFAPPRTTKPEVTLWAKLVSAAEGQPVGMVDGLLFNFDNNYSTEIDKMDVKKFFSAANNLSVLSKGYYLVAERTAYPKATDSIQLILSSTAQQGYRLDFEPTHVEKLGVKPYLYDRYLGTYHPIAVASGTSVPFTINSEAGSKAINRFKIVFKRKGSLQLDLNITLAARNTDRTIVVNWAASNEQEVEKYEVERSADGRLFTGILTTPAQKNETLTLYSQRDIGPLAGDNYYRIKAVCKDGVLFFSEVLKVAAEQPAFETKGTITVYPNPVSGKRMQVEFREQEQGRYQLQLINSLGQVVQSTALFVDRNYSKQQVRLEASVKPGQYQLNITAPGGKQIVQKVFVE